MIQDTNKGQIQHHYTSYGEIAQIETYPKNDGSKYKIAYYLVILDER